MPVRVVYRKYDSSLHWHMELSRLGDDEHGTWLGAPAGSLAQRGTEEPVTFEQAYVLLIPRGTAWWTMTCNAADAWTELYIDITTVPRWITTDLVEMVDLDLDVVRLWDGSAEILDGDEFAEHQVRYRYPAEVIMTAEQTAASMLSAVERRAEPFGQVCRRWLATVPVSSDR